MKALGGPFRSSSLRQLRKCAYRRKRGVDRETGAHGAATIERAQSAASARPFAIAFRLFGWSLVAVSAPASTSAVSQEAPSEQASTQNQASGPTGDVLGAQNLLQLMDEVRTAPGTGLNGAPTTVTTDTLKLRGDVTLNLNSLWQLALRSDLPFVAKNPVSDSNPDGEYLYGVGDADIQAALIENIDDRWKAGFGARLIAPTGGDTLGSGKWRIMPLGGVRYELPEISPGSYLEPLLRYDVSFAGDPAKRSISNLQLAPMLNIGLPDRWFFTLYPNPEIRVNFGDPITGQTGRLFLPFDARIGHKFTDNFNVSLEVGVPIVKDYPVYNLLTALRMNLTF